jgi:hypothetical protein
MAIRTELTVKLHNTPGALAQVCRILADERVNILACSVEKDGTTRLVVDNPVHAAGTLREHHYEVAERDVLYIEIPNGPGALSGVARLLADAGVNLDYVYGSVADGAATAAIVAGVPDAQRASAAAGV